MKSAFEQALAYTFVNEGGFSNEKADHGGATMFGITRADASRWRRHPVSVSEMRDFPIEEAKEIYKAWYWGPVGSDKITHTGIAICMFDIGVVRGISVPPKYAQRICNEHGGSLVLDGHIGPKTLAAVNGMNPDLFIASFAEMVESGFRAIVTNNPTQKVFLKGWVVRARRLLTLLS